MIVPDNLAIYFHFGTLQLLDSGLSWQEELESSLKSLAHLLRDEKTISAYEVHHSRLVPVLLYCLAGSVSETMAWGSTSEAKLSRCGVVGDKAAERVNIFKQMFALSGTEDSYSELDSRRVYIYIITSCVL